MLKFAQHFFNYYIKIEFQYRLTHTIVFAGFPIIRIKANKDNVSNPSQPLYFIIYIVSCNSYTLKIILI